MAELGTPRDPRGYRQSHAYVGVTPITLALPQLLLVAPITLDRSTGCSLYSFQSIQFTLTWMLRGQQATGNTRELLSLELYYLKLFHLVAALGVKLFSNIVPCDQGTWMLSRVKVQIPWRWRIL